jgi:hypothetical protein
MPPLTYGQRRGTPQQRRSEQHAEQHERPASHTAAEVRESI